MATPRVAAGVIFRDDHGRVLLVKPTYKDGWDVPGGYVEPGESPRTAAIREVREELGIKPDIGQLLVVDWAPHPNEGDKLLFLFLGKTLPPSTTFMYRDGEIASADFYDAADLDDLVPPRLARRVAYALRQPRANSDVYLEHGESVS